MHVLALDTTTREGSVAIARDGDVRHCQGTVLADWTAATVDGQPRGRGTNVFTFGANGHIAAVTGFWN